MSESKSVLAKSVYDTLCAHFDKLEWKYSKYDEDLVITYSISGDDLPMDFILIVDEELQLIKILSTIPVKVPEDKRMDMALAVCKANFGMAHGRFDFDILTGEIEFRVVQSFRDCVVTEKLFPYLVILAETMVDKYNDKFLAIAKGFINIADFLLQDE